MTRPNELQQLDEDLAAGRLSPEDHRRRRDELERDAASTAGSAPQAASPFPPAFRWEASPPEATRQVMAAVPQDTDLGDPAEATQVVRRGDVQDSERTQVVQPSPSYPPSPSYQPNPSYPPSPSYQLGSGQVRGLFQPVDSSPADNSDRSAPPWAHSDLPPIADQQSAWMRQGPEVFETPALQSRSKQIIGIAVLAVVVVGLVGSGVAYSLSTSSPNQASNGQLEQPQPNQPQPDQAQLDQTQPDQTQPTADARALPAPPAPRQAPVDTSQALIDPPGRTRAGGGLLDLPQVQSGNLVPRPILNALRAGGMIDGMLKTTTEGANTIGMFAFTLRDEQAATEVAETIATVQRDGGLKDDDNRAQQGVPVLGTDPSSPSTVYRAVYVLYNRVVFFETMGPYREAVQATFDSLIRQQVTYAPPTVR